MLIRNGHPEDPCQNSKMIDNNMYKGFRKGIWIELVKEELTATFENEFEQGARQRHLKEP